MLVWCRLTKNSCMVSVEDSGAESSSSLIWPALAIGTRGNKLRLSGGSPEWTLIRDDDSMPHTPVFAPLTRFELEARATRGPSCFYRLRETWLGQSLSGEYMRRAATGCLLFRCQPSLTDAMAAQQAFCAQVDPQLAVLESRLVDVRIHRLHRKVHVDRDLADRAA